MRLASSKCLPTVLFTHFVNANQQPDFSIRVTATVNNQNVHKASKLIIAEIHPNDTKVPGKRPIMVINIFGIKNNQSFMSLLDSQQLK